MPTIHYYTEWINSKVLQYSSGNYIFCDKPNRIEYGKEYIYINIRIIEITLLSGEIDTTL